MNAETTAGPAIVKFTGCANADPALVPTEPGSLEFTG